MSGKMHTLKHRFTIAPRFFLLANWGLTCCVCFATCFKWQTFVSCIFGIPTLWPLSFVWKRHHCVTSFPLYEKAIIVSHEGGKNGVTGRGWKKHGASKKGTHPPLHTAACRTYIIRLFDRSQIWLSCDSVYINTYWQRDTCTLHKMCHVMIWHIALIKICINWCFKFQLFVALQVKHQGNKTSKANWNFRLT